MVQRRLQGGGLNMEGGGGGVATKVPLLLFMHTQPNHRDTRSHIMGNSFSACTL